MRIVARIACLAALACSVATPLAAEAWLTYANPRFGAIVDYPPVFSVRAEPPANSDGQRFFTADGRATLAVFGFYNVLNETARQMLGARRDAGTSYSYAAATADSFALSGTKAGRISYLRCIRSRFAREVVQCAELEYPEAEASRWSGIVTRVSRSLRSGKPW